MASLEQMYKPSPQDVFAVKRAISRACRSMPIDLVDLIIDFAEYWPHTATLFTSGARAQGRHKEHVFVMRSKPLCIEACEPSPSTASPSAVPAAPPSAAGEVAAVPEPPLTFPARRVVWTLVSHDQGFSGSPDTQGTYAHSWTGFDAGAERYHPAHSAAPAAAHNAWTSADYLAAWPGPTAHAPGGEPPAHEWPRGAKPDAWGPPLAHPPEAHYAVPDPPTWPRRGWDNREMRLQSNVHARAAPTTHVVAWDWRDAVDPESPRAQEELDAKGRGRYTGDGRLVRSLQRGDCVTLWAHAFFPQWVNYVDGAKIEVYFAV